MDRKNRRDDIQDLQSAIGANILRWREKRGLSQEALGEMVGLTKATISRYESGARLARIPELESLRKALRVPLSALFRRPED